jgi:UDP-N-acetylglucosamine transferase subunit ALG13
MTAAVDVLVVCSSGGHLFDAVAVSPAWRERSRAWVSFDKADVRSLLRDEQVYTAYGPTNRNIPNLIRNFGLAARILGRTRPRVLVTTGAGVAVPFAWLARLRGTQVIYVECAGRVDRPSLSARMIAPVAHAIYAQWPELAAAWKRARYAGNTLLRAPEQPPPPGTGVLVTVGTNEARFDRLLAAVDALDLGGERVIVQYGSSRVRPEGAELVEFLPFDELDALTRSARAVVCHAGIGSVAMALAHGRRPIVVPRLREHGEAVDDHQVFFARRLEAAGLATVVEDLDELGTVLAAGHGAPAPEPGPDLAIELKSALDAALAS